MVIVYFDTSPLFLWLWILVLLFVFPIRSRTNNHFGYCRQWVENISGGFLCSFHRWLPNIPVASGAWSWLSLLVFSLMTCLPLSRQWWPWFYRPDNAYCRIIEYEASLFQAHGLVYKILSIKNSRKRRRKSLSSRISLRVMACQAVVL